MSIRSQARGQGGYALLELAVALLIASLLAVWGAQALVNRFNDVQAQAAAVWMTTLHKGLIAYVQRHGLDIQAATGADALLPYGFADWAAPTVQEMMAAGLLSPGTPQETRLTGAARLDVWRNGACPGDACMVEALVHGERPLRDAGGTRPDQAMMAQWLLAARGEGAAVHPDDPSSIRGAAFAFDNALPDGTVLPVGTVGMGVTAEHLALWSYLRVRDPRDPDFQGSLSVQGNLYGEGDIDLAGQLVIGAQHSDGTLCHPPGAVAHDLVGGLLVCRNGRWRSASRTGGGGYGYNTLYGCQTRDGLPTGNPITGACSCPWYTATVQILDMGEPPYPNGRQYAYLCIG